MDKKTYLSDRNLEQLAEQMDETSAASSRPYNQEEHELAKKLLAMAELSASEKHFDTERAWQKFARKHRIISNRKRFYTFIVTTAAILLIVLVMNYHNESPATIQHTEIVSLYTITNSKPTIRADFGNGVLQDIPDHKTINFQAQNATSNIKVITPASKKAEIILPDGSLITLNAESKLTYNQTSEKRTVYLEGEAFFDVKKHPLPFIIRSGNAVSKVLGTTFNIKSYRSERTSITLLQGSLKITSERKHAVIKPGDEAVLDKNGQINILQVAPENMAAWTKGEFLFDNMKVEEIVRELGRYYNLNVKTSLTTIPERQIHLRCSRKTDITTLVRMLNDISGIHLEIQGNTLLLN